MELILSLAFVLVAAGAIGGGIYLDRSSLNKQAPSQTHGQRGC